MRATPLIKTMDKALKKELKTDELAEVTENTLEYVSAHKQDFTRYGVIAAAVILAGLLGWWFMRYRADQRATALSEVLSIREATIGPEPKGGAVKNYATDADRDKALDKAIDSVMSQYPGSEEAAVALYYRGVMAAEKDNVADAQKAFTTVASSGTEFAPMAKYSLAGIHSAEGRPAEAEKLLREIIANPSPLVSKEQATLELGRLLKTSNPGEARKLLEPLRTGRGAIARNAVALLSEIEKK